jgi:hypothetical protein
MPIPVVQITDKQVAEILTYGVTRILKFGIPLVFPLVSLENF